MKVLMPVGGFPTEDHPQSGVFNETAAKQISAEVELTVVHFRYWKLGRKLISTEEKDNFIYKQVCIPTIPRLHENWSKFHFFWYSLLIRLLLKKELRGSQIVHCVQGEIGLWFSLAKKGHSFKLLTQFIGTDLVSELKEHRCKPWIKNWVNNLDSASFNSKMLKNLFASYYPQFSKPEYVVYRGCDINRFKPTEEKKENEEMIFFFLGGLANYKMAEGRNVKGGVDLLYAWKQYKDEGGKGKLIFAGADSLAEVAREIVDSAKLEDIDYLGPLNKDKVLENYRLSDVVIIPSRQDGLPNVSYEAQASGNPVIGARVGGIPESVANKETGLLFESGNIQELVDCIRLLEENRELFDRMSTNARERAVSQLDSTDFGKNYKKIYDELCAE